MDEKEGRIRKAANELAASLTDHGGDFYVTYESFDTTNFESFERSLGYSIVVKLVAEKAIAP